MKPFDYNKYRKNNPLLKEGYTPDERIYVGKPAKTGPLAVASDYLYSMEKALKQLDRVIDKNPNISAKEVITMVLNTLQKVKDAQKKGDPSFQGDFSMNEAISRGGTFMDELQKLNPGYSRQSVMAAIEDEFEKQDDWGDTDVSGDYEDHQEYLQDAQEWFDKIESTGPTVKVGDIVKVRARSIGKEVVGKIVGENVMKGSFMANGNVKPDNIPAWTIDCYKDENMKIKLGTLSYPKYAEGEDFTRLA